MRTPLLPWLFGVGLALLPAIASAEEPPTKNYPDCSREPTEAEVAAAKGAYQAGSASYDEADYTRAIDYWEDAYRRDCTANALLLNLARAYEVSGRKRQAIVALDTFLKREPSSAQKDQISRRIEVLKKQIETAAPAPAPVTTPQPATTGPGPAATTPQPLPNEPPPDPAAAGGKRSLVPLAVAGAGGVILIIGTAMYFPAASDVEMYESRCMNPAKREGCPPDQLDDANAARSKQNLGTGLMIGGAVVAAGGLAWYFLSPKRPAAAETRSAPRRAEIVPAVAPGFAGLNVSGRF